MRNDGLIVSASDKDGRTVWIRLDNIGWAEELFAEEDSDIAIGFIGRHSMRLPADEGRKVVDCWLAWVELASSNVRER